MIGKDQQPSIGKETQFTTDKQPTNRRKPSIITAAKKMMFSEDAIKLKGVTEITDKGVPTGKKVNVQIKIDNEQGYALLLLKKARGSDHLLKFLIEQIDGKATAEVVHKVDLEDFDVDALNENQKEVFIHLLNIGMGKIENDDKLKRSL